WFGGSWAEVFGWKLGSRWAGWSWLCWATGTSAL
ncbi:unnamed protein product, partial [Rhizophagus irregularis]